jgi:hypothetical protein
MKCLKSSKTGNIIRVSDREAYNSTSEWKFIPKSEWKADRRPAKKVVEEVKYSDEANYAAAVSLKTAAAYQDELTIAEKQLNKKKKDK